MSANAEAHAVPRGDGWHTGDVPAAAPATCDNVNMTTLTTLIRGQYQEWYVWTFHPPAGTTRCHLSILVPGTGEGLAHYDLFNGGPMTRQYKLDDTHVDQTTRRGEWLTVGEWPATDGLLRLRLTDQPHDDLTAPYHVAASAVKATCR